IAIITRGRRRTAVSAVAATGRVAATGSADVIGVRAISVAAVPLAAQRIAGARTDATAPIAAAHAALVGNDGQVTTAWSGSRPRAPPARVHAGGAVAIAQAVFRAGAVAAQTSATVPPPTHRVVAGVVAVSWCADRARDALAPALGVVRIERATAVVVTR